MVNKVHRIVIGSIDNRDSYPIKCCEICGQSGHIHHHIEQQYSICGEVFVIELHINYSNLCITHHPIAEKNPKQYDKEVYGHSFAIGICWKPYEHWHKLKDEVDHEKLILDWIEAHDKDWFYKTRLAKVRDVLLQRLGRE